MSAFDTLERQLHNAASRRRRRRPLWLLVPAGAAAALAVLLLALVGGGSRGKVPGDEREAVATATPTMASPAAAVPTFVPVDPKKIVYVRTTTVDVTRTGAGDRTSTSVMEEWHRGRETHRLVGDGAHVLLDHVIDADGTMHQIDELGRYRVIRGSNADDASRDATNVIAEEQAGFLASFRKRAEAGTFDRSENVTFAGKRAYRFLIAGTAATRANPPANGATGTRINPQAPEQSYYMDRATGEPLGLTSVLRLGPTVRPDLVEPQTNAEPSMTATETVNTIKYLDPTAENLAKLHTLTLKRRG